MFKYRIISFVGLLGILAAAFLWREGGKYIFTVLAVGGAFGLVYEVGGLLELIGIVLFKKSTALAAVLLVLVTAMNYLDRWISVTAFVLLFFIFLAGWAGLLYRDNRKSAIRQLINSLGMLLLVILPVLPLVALYDDDWSRGICGAGLIYLVLVTKAGDTGAYIVGMLSGKLLPHGNHKIVPKISPKKSWEGTIGGLLCSVAVSLAFFYGNFNLVATLWGSLFLGIVLFFGGFAGDLTESALKRTCGVKDSGAIIPGMGGIFDVLDSFIYNGIIFFFIKALFVV